MSVLPRCICDPFGALVGDYDPRCSRHLGAHRILPVGNVPAPAREAQSLADYWKDRALRAEALLASEAPTQTKVEARAGLTDAIRDAGYTLSHCAYNLAQRKPGEFTQRDIDVLDEARKRWDAAIEAAGGTKP